MLRQERVTCRDAESETSMRSALIGHTGFVGKTLAAQHAFAAEFNSSNIHEAEGQAFDLVACAAAPGSMFEANRFPEADDRAIDGLIARLGKIRAKSFILISTIAVLDRFDGQATETTEAFQTQTPYGRNRRRLEVFCAERFADCLILRLPALFGPGLRKNFLFDLLNPAPSMLTPPRFEAAVDAVPAPLRDAMRALYHHNAALGLWVLDRAALNASDQKAVLETALEAAGFSAVGFTHPESRFQFYDMSQLWRDAVLAQKAGLSVLHLAPEPLSAGQVHLALTGRAMAPNEARVHHEDMHSLHAGLWGRTGPYLRPASDCLIALQRFFAAERA